MTRKSPSPVKRYSFVGYSILIMQAMLQASIVFNGKFCLEFIKKSIKSENGNVGTDELIRQNMFVPDYHSVFIQGYNDVSDKFEDKFCFYYIFNPKFTVLPVQLETPFGINERLSCVPNRYRMSACRYDKEICCCPEVQKGCCYGLHCWKCISESCHLHPSDAHQAVRVACQEGQSCVKALYQMGQTTPRYRSVIRTCSAGRCVPMMEDEFQNCSSNPRKYNVTGCALRLCCNDQDFCNGTSRKESVAFDIGQFALFLGLMVLS